MLQKIIDVLQSCLDGDIPAFPAAIYPKGFPQAAQKILELFDSEKKKKLKNKFTEAGARARERKYQIAREMYDEYTGLKNVLSPFHKWLDQQLEQEAEDKDMKDDLHEDLATGRG